MRRLSRVAVGLVVSLAACGVAPSDTATADRDEVPYDLLAPGEPVRETTSSTAPASRTVAVWFVVGDRIVPLERTVPSPPDLDDLLGALVGGPTAGESRLGVRTAIVGEDEIASSSSGSVATIELPAGLAESAPREQLLGLAQLVYVATELDSVDTVRFTVDGEAVGVPRADGSISDGPVRRADYAVLKI